MIKIDTAFAQLCRPLSGDEREQLRENLLIEGCRDPLVVWKEEGVLLDGHNRMGLCAEHDIDYQVREISLADRQAAYSWIINNQLGRRNITPEDASYLRGKRYNAEKRQGARTDLTSDQSGRKLADQRLADEYKVGEATIRRDGKFAAQVDEIADNVGREFRDEVLARDSRISRKEVDQLARLSPEAQKQTVEKVATGQAKSVIDARRQVARETVKETPILEGKYRVFYADPPWQYGNDADPNYSDQDKHYPTMSIEELCALPVKSLAEDNAVLFVWVTSPILEESFPVIRAWGFQYKASFIWDKVRHNFGHYNSVRHEFLLIGVRGSCTPEVQKLIDSVQSIERTDRHSEKPAEFREIVDTLYPSGARIELFARQSAEGWKAHGNQI